MMPSGVGWCPSKRAPKATPGTLRRSHHTPLPGTPTLKTPTESRTTTHRHRAVRRAHPPPPLGPRGPARALGVARRLEQPQPLHDLAGSCLGCVTDDAAVQLDYVMGRGRGRGGGVGGGGHPLEDEGLFFYCVAAAGVLFRYIGRSNGLLHTIPTHNRFTHTTVSHTRTPTSTIPASTSSAFAGPCVRIWHAAVK